MECLVYDVNVLEMEQRKSRLVSGESILRMGELFKVFSDPTRLSIMQVLSLGECCVCDLAHVLGLTQSCVSHQLNVLRTSRLVAYRRDGKKVFYRLLDDHVMTIFQQALDHIGEE
jgi:ArsR family transcriptional regulator, lead/cadmium/zinc/bismuth-responsive transcriptional repressor